MKRNTFYTLLFASLLLVSACQSEEKCKTGKPIPLFDKSQATITNHDFSLTGNNSLEKFTLPNGANVDFSQTGCEEVVQTFSITNPEADYTILSDNEWKLMAVNYFRGFATLDPNLALFEQWGVMIEQRLTEIKLGEPLMLEPGRFITIDKIASQSEGVLIIKLSNKS